LHSLEFALEKYEAMTRKNANEADNDAPEHFLDLHLLLGFQLISLSEKANCSFGRFIIIEYSVCLLTITCATFFASGITG
jgi:hypothetical protein